MKYIYLGFTKNCIHALIEIEIYFINVIDKHERNIKIKINPDKWPDFKMILNKYIPLLNFK